jgi:ubiquitin-conjugating enzyme E2 G1
MIIIINIMPLKRLVKEYKHITKEPTYNYSVEATDNFLIWNFIIIGPNETLYEGGMFKGIIEFNDKYPISPPIVRFHNIIHPNIYKDGKVCISILHEGSDIFGYEKDIERWNPSHGIDSVMISIISMLSAPNFDSPADIDSSILWKDNMDEYKKTIYRLVAQSQI